MSIKYRELSQSPVGNRFYPFVCIAMVSFYVSRDVQFSEGCEPILD